MSESNQNPETAVPSDPDITPESITAWVCPNCGAWAGSSSTPDLSATHNYRTAMRNLADDDPAEWGKSIGPRSICQVCRQNGEGDFERMPVIYVPLSYVTSSLEEQVEERYRQEEKASGVKLRRLSSDPTEAPDSQRRNRRRTDKG